MPPRPTREPIYDNTKANVAARELFTAPDPGATTTTPVTEVFKKVNDSLNAPRGAVSPFVLNLAKAFDAGGIDEEKSQYLTFMRDTYHLARAQADLTHRWPKVLTDPASHPPKLRMIDERTFIARYGITAVVILFENNQDFRRDVGRLRPNDHKGLVKIIDRHFLTAAEKEKLGIRPARVAAASNTAALDQIARESTIVDITAMLLAKTYTPHKTEKIVANVAVFKGHVVEIDRRGSFNHLQAIHEAQKVGTLPKQEYVRNLNHDHLVARNEIMHTYRQRNDRKRAELRQQQAADTSRGWRRAGNTIARTAERALHVSQRVLIEVGAPIVEKANDSLLNFAHMYALYQVAKFAQELTNLSQNPDKTPWHERIMTLIGTDIIVYRTMVRQFRDGLDGWRTGKSGVATSVGTLMAEGYVAGRLVHEIRDRFGNPPPLQNWFGIGRGRWRLENVRHIVRIDANDARIEFLNWVQEKAELIAIKADEVDRTSTLAKAVVDFVDNNVSSPTVKKNIFEKAIGKVLELADSRMRTIEDIADTGEALAELMEVPARIIHVAAISIAEDAVGLDSTEGLFVEKFIRFVRRYAEVNARGSGDDYRDLVQGNWPRNPGTTGGATGRGGRPTPPPTPAPGTRAATPTVPRRTATPIPPQIVTPAPQPVDRTVAVADLNKMPADRLSQLMTFVRNAASKAEAEAALRRINVPEPIIKTVTGLVFGSNQPGTITP